MLRALETFTCFPDGDYGEERVVSKGEIFEIEDEAYAEILVLKGHAEMVWADTQTKGSDGK